MSGAITSYVEPQMTPAADLHRAETRRAVSLSPGLLRDVLDITPELPLSPPPVEVEWGLPAVTETVDTQHRRLFEQVALGREQMRAMVTRLGSDAAQCGLLAVLEARLPETYDHSQRVAMSATILAHVMRLPAKDAEAIRSAALFHDIGKIAIPAAVLGRSGPLTDDEVVALRMHVTIGAEILAEISSLEPISRIVAATHERYDGRGYAEGLAGTDIPLGARVIAVADAYDAMTARRPYGVPLSALEANNELMRCSMSHFDPNVVHAWMDVLAAPRCA